MDIALSPGLPTYSGGLAMLAGDTLRSAADTSAPMVAISLVHRRGYFRQKLSDVGQQTETDVPWSPETTLPSANKILALTMQGRQILVRAWRFDVTGITGHVIPVFLLDTDVEGNDPWDRRLTDHLYGGDTYYRLCQETVLGLGGVALLHALDCEPEVYHMNEGHAALLAIGLLEDRLAGKPLRDATEDDIEAVRQLCVFTTHTPVPAGHDQFGIDQMYQVLGHDRAAAIDQFGCLHNGLMNMTYIALRFSRFVNGVAMQHGKVSQQMFPGYKVYSITNGVHAATWLSPQFQDLLDSEIPHWRTDNHYLRSIYGIEPARIAAAHNKGKLRLFATIAKRTGHHFNPNVLTLGFARRVATYKRASLLLHDTERLLAIAQKIGGLQILYAGKAHPADSAGKGLIRDVYSAAAKLNSSALKIFYLENYDWELGALLTQGVDVWVNTPRRLRGLHLRMAALNGVLTSSSTAGSKAAPKTPLAGPSATAKTRPTRPPTPYEKPEHPSPPVRQATPMPRSRCRQTRIAINGSFFNTTTVCSRISKLLLPTQVGKIPVAHSNAPRSSGRPHPGARLSLTSKTTSPRR
jgi:starch phosphorylase